MKRGFLIFNPTAGSQPKSKNLVDSVVRRFEKGKIEIVPKPTEGDGNVSAQVRRVLQENPDLIVAWGGDGTINEVVNGIFGSNVPMGILPGGTANVMVRELGIPVKLEEAVDVINQGKLRSISVGQANDRYFLLMVGIGFDSAVIRNVTPVMKKTLGKLAFGISAMNTAVTYRYPKFHVRYDDGETDGVFAVICNARRYAAYFMLTPEADIADDYFYLCVFQDPGLASMFFYAFHALRRTHTALPSVRMIRTKNVEVTGSEDIAVQADGELVGALPVRLTLHPGSQQVFHP